MDAEAGNFRTGVAAATPAQGADLQIYHLKAPRFPQFRFEWHPSKKTVYLVRIGETPEFGDPIAENADDHGRAQMAVLIFLRGYRAAKAELTKGTEYDREAG